MDNLFALDRKKNGKLQVINARRTTAKNKNKPQ